MLEIDGWYKNKLHCNQVSSPMGILLFEYQWGVGSGSTFQYFKSAVSSDELLDGVLQRLMFFFWVRSLVRIRLNIGILLDFVVSFDWYFGFLIFLLVNWNPLYVFIFELTALSLFVMREASYKRVCPCVGPSVRHTFYKFHDWIFPFPFFIF